MPPRGKGRGRGRGGRGAASRSVRVPPPEKMTTRNRGSGRSVLRKRSITPITTRNKNKGYRMNGKRPWEDSDGEVENIKTEPIAASSDDDTQSDNDDEYMQDHIKMEIDPDEELDDTDVSIDLAPVEEEAIICPWLEEGEIPQLLLPRPCHDLIVNFSLFMDMVHIYETVTTYYRLIQITPFLFDDFCAAMRVEAASKLVAEIHIALMKVLLRDDDQEETIYAVTETSVSFQLLFQLLEPVTFGAVLKQYVESDARFPQEIKDILKKNYPFVSPSDRVCVLQWLCNRFLDSALLKKEIKNEGKIMNESYCRECAKPGDLLLCDGCEASYHMKCLGFPEIPASDWYCDVCKQLEIHGVTDCEISRDKSSMHRKTPLGYDRHGRLYWFLVRRLIVEDYESNTVFVYSTLPAIYELCSSLDASYYEARLCANIYKIIDTIADHCNITLKLTHSRRDELGAKLGNKELEQTYIDKDCAHRMIYIAYNIASKTIVKNELLDLDESTQDGVPPNLPYKLEKKLQKHLGFENGKLVSTIWSFGVEQEHLIERRNDFVAALGYPQDTAALPLLEDYCRELNIAFRLSFSDGGYRKFDNIYDTNEYAKPTAQRIKERDRKKYISTRFCLDEQFMWAVTKGKTMFVDANLFGRHIQITLRRIVERLPDELFHRLWKGHNKEVFTAKLSKASTPEAIRDCLLQFESVLRKPAFTNAWWNSLGHTSLIRQTHADREKRTLLDTQKKKEERELAIADQSYNNDIVWVNAPRQKNICKNLWRMKNEQYRLNGKGALGGWVWISKMYTKDHVDSIEKPELGINFETPVEKLTTKASKKASRLDKLAKKLTCWRDAQEEEKILALIPKCFSPSCGKYSSFVNGKSTNCYAVNCPKRSAHVIEIESDTSAVAKAFDPVRRRTFLAELRSKTEANTRGEGIPFPFPIPFNYRHPKTKEQSILILPKFTLKKLCKSGGVKTIYVHGFNRAAKSNYNVWNYPCSRPVFDNCWRYLTHHANTLHSIALQIRILFASIRWSDLEPDFDEGETILISHPEYDEKRFVVGHKEHAPDGYYETYKLRIELIALDDDGLPEIQGDVIVDNDVSISVATPTPSVKASRKSIRRKSKKTNESALSMKTNVSRKFVERWIDGVELKLFEIVAYWKRYNEKKPQIRLHKSTPSQNTNLQRFSNLQGQPAPKRPSPSTSNNSRKRNHDANSPPVITNKIVILDDPDKGKPLQTPRIITIDRRKQNLNGNTPIIRQSSSYTPRADLRNMFPLSTPPIQNLYYGTPQPMRLVRRSDGLSIPLTAGGNQFLTVRQRPSLIPGPRLMPAYRPTTASPYRPSASIRSILGHPPGRQVFLQQRQPSVSRPIQSLSTESQSQNGTPQ